MPWTQVSLVLPASALTAVEAVFLALGAISIAHEDAGSTPWFEPAANAPSPWERVRLIALLAPDVSPERIRAALAADLDAAALESLVFEAVPDRDWAREWMRDWRPQRFGRRLWICPTWLEPPDPGAVNVRLDPGNAFGTGTHASTALGLEWLEARDLGGCTVLDYGCGSGVLAIAALRLGAAQAWACDTDAAALRVTSENAVRNGVAADLWIGAPSALPERHVDLVVANILSGVLVDLAPQFATRVHPGGCIALAGILCEQADAVIAAYRPWCPLRVTATRADWVLLAGVVPHS